MWGGASSPLLLSLSCQEWDLLPNYWIRSPHGQIQSCSIALECVPWSKGGDCWSKWGPCVHRGPMCHLCIHVRFCSEAAQGHVLFSVYDPYLRQGWCEIGCDWGLGHCGWRYCYSCAATWDLGCHLSLLPGSACTRSSTKLLCVMGKARVLLLGE